jgi:2-polyprenyl-3-methyl-5-hydroxy-6-metoxy-1,4-benzoquinol methylase
MNHLVSEHCTLCKGNDFKVLFDREFRVLLCKSCSLMFIGSSDETDLKDYYHEGYYHGIKKKQVDSPSTRRRIKWLSPYLDDWESKQVLEIGCGQGHLLKAIQNQGAQVHGIEPSVPDSLIAGSLSGHENISVGMLSDFQTQAVYDAVVLIHSFEHMPHPMATLQHIRTLLKPNGRLFVEVPNFFSTTGFYRKRKGVHSYPSPNHLFIYTPGTLIGMLKKNGFENISKAYNYHNMRLVFRPSQDRSAFKESGVRVYKKVWVFFLVLKFMAGAKNLLHRLLRVLKNRSYTNPTTRIK